MIQNPLNNAMRAALAILFSLGASVALAQDFTTLKGHGGPIMDIAISDTGQIVTASFDNSVGLWTGRVPYWIEGHDAAVNTVWLNDEFGLSGGDDFRVLLWPLSGPETEPLELIRHQGKVTDVAYHDNAGLFASASWDGTVAVRRIEQVWKADEESLSTERVVLKGHAAGVNAVVFDNAGRLYSASADGTIRMWDAVLSETTARVIVSHGFGINELVLNETRGWLAYGAVDGVTRIIDMNTEEVIRDFTLDRRPILAMAYHSETSQLAVGDGQGYIMIIDTDAWKITRDFRATRHGPVWALAFSPEGETIYAGGLDDVAYGWPVALIDKHEPAMSGERSFLRSADTMPNGERQFMRKCSICHALEAGASRKAGPTLHGLFGRRAGTVPGYRYSPILVGSDIVWSEGTIDALFDLGPDHYIPGSKMPMQRIAAHSDRDDLITYLKSATRAGE
ncbi:cytochrome C [Alisedimentitalea sp. MJ-SS2]|uniref:c-type cytochrome n=1 Tax=Aliisedimentitalea sp. MJ-SS2 TaxID=3049795 RepID=UPI0029136ABA|nr:c-type cytochrome [Alisedimentitalea sp. MJ-SS2]MDU8929365.1 cytochrome C [Alisedimentitalea sp. MJ-SS2]